VPGKSVILDMAVTKVRRLRSEPAIFGRGGEEVDGLAPAGDGALLLDEVVHVALGGTWG
jgi:hypothetical protein